MAGYFWGRGNHTIRRGPRGGSLPVPLLADAPDPVLERHAELAKMEDPGFAGFLPEHGHELYLRKRVLPVVGAINCASCHMADPREEIIAHKSKVLGRQCHVINDSEHPHPKDAKLRKIQPLAPSANPKRVTNFDHVEEFLKPIGLSLFHDTFFPSSQPF